MKPLKPISVAWKVAVEEYGMTILHILCYFPSLNGWVLTAMRELIEKCPEMVECIDNTGRTALHHLIEFNHKREAYTVKYLASCSNKNVLYEMISCQSSGSDVKLAIVEVISLNKYELLSAIDEESGLLPFMSACVGKDYDLAVAYKLFRLKPDNLLIYYQL